MTPLVFIKAWAVTALFFVIIDGIWLGIAARSFYQRQLEGLMRENVNLPVAALFYISFCAAIVYLASLSGLRENSAFHALSAGAVLGLAAYGTYDFTNLATLKNWPVKVVIIDIVWGGLITAGASYVGYRALVYFT